MTDTAPEIRSIPVKDITVLNPRARNKKIFNELVMSIAHLGLKKPITVSAHKEGSSYDLVCGQGRLEAFIALGQEHIPAIVIEASVEDCFVMSLVENLARRQHSSLEFVREIGALRERGYSLTEIAVKTDFSEEYVYAICYPCSIMARTDSSTVSRKALFHQASRWRSLEPRTATFRRR